MAASRLKTPPTAIPISRKGKVSSQTIGKRISAKRARGQHSRKRMYQRKKAAMETYSFICGIAERRYPPQPVGKSATAV
jgi:hypothetical protein